MHKRPVRSYVILCSCLTLAAVSGCARGDDQTLASDTPSLQGDSIPAAPSHLEMYLADPMMPLDHSVIVEIAELAEDSLAIAAKPSESIAVRIRDRLNKDGLSLDSSFKAHLHAFRGGDPSPVSGDGQALILSNGTALSYGPYIRMTVPKTLSTDLPTANLRWAASLTNVGGTLRYDPLSIEAGASYCVYLGRDSGWNITSYLVRVYDVTEECRALGALTVQQLTDMKAVKLGGFAQDPKDIDQDFDGDDLPKAARFEWSPSLRANLIGVRCGDRWCTIGPATIRPSDGEPIPPPDGSTSKEEKKVKRLKGWYDSQILAVRGANGLVPSGVLARFVPHHEMKDTFGKKEDWYLIGTVHLSGGAVPQKYLDRGFTNGSNRVNVCRGTYTECGGSGNPPKVCAKTGQLLWLRIYSEVGLQNGPIFQLCHMSNPAENDAPFAVRWAWDPMDEGMWVRCLNGCCQPEF